jgi:hypothetical protein
VLSKAGKAFSGIEFEVHGIKTIPLLRNYQVSEIGGGFGIRQDKKSVSSPFDFLKAEDNLLTSIIFYAENNRKRWTKL